MTIEFRNWRDKNFPNRNEDCTSMKRNATIALSKELKANHNNIEKLQKFIDSAKASIDEMKQFMREKSADKVNTNTNKVVNNVQIERNK